MAHYQRIRDLREDADKTQTDIATFLGTTAQYYGKYEKGDRELPFTRAIELAKYYNVSLDYLAGRTNTKQTRFDTSLNKDEMKMLQQFRKLSERNKGKAEFFFEQLLESQSETENEADKKDA